MRNQMTEDEKLKVEQAKHRAQLAENRAKLQEKKNRTRRLIQHGAIAESMIPGAESMNEAEFEFALIDAMGK